MSEVFTTPSRVALLAKAAEDGLVAALEWLPYPSDFEQHATKELLQKDLDRVTRSLDFVRNAYKEAENAIVKAALEGEA